jgi:prepilin-type N-terminal cleavage/methylation domain-containing protein
MNSTLLYLQHSSTRSYLAGISPGSSKSLVLGICRTRVRQIPRGFTLVEIAIAIFIITILLGSILVPLTTQVEQRQVSETQKMLEDIKEALIGHAVAKGYLPCPDRTTGGTGTANDTANDGVEDYGTPTAGLCFGTGTTTGNVPWQTLGLGAMDPWGNRFRYRVDADFAHHTTLFSFTTSADLCVGLTQPSCTTPFTGRLTGASPDGAVAVIISHGKNGYGAMNALTNTVRPAPTSADELDNSAGGPSYTSHTITPLGSVAGEFDDIVIWMGKFTLYSRMVAAGKLP